MRSRSWLVPLALTLAAAGCTEEKVTRPGGKKAAAAPKPAEEPVKSRETIGKRTQTVLKLSDAQQQGGVPANMTIPVADPLTQSAAGYRTSVGKLAIDQVYYAIQLRNAQSIQDPKPLTYDE